MWVIENEEIWQSIIDQNGQMEFDWLGIDKYGQIAIFSNLNSGFTPNCVTNSMTLYNELVSFIESLEKTSEAIKVAKGNGIYDEWEEFAQKGILGYDIEDVHSVYNPDRYHLLYKPTISINAKDYSDLEKFEPIIPVFNIEFKDFLTFDELKQAVN